MRAPPFEGDRQGAFLKLELLPAAGDLRIPELHSRQCQIVRGSELHGDRPAGDTEQEVLPRILDPHRGNTVCGHDQRQEPVSVHPGPFDGEVTSLARDEVAFEVLIPEPHAYAAGVVEPNDGAFEDVEALRLLECD